MLNFVLLLVISYLFGSFPTAILAGKLLKKIDIRDYGSGNAGATNVFRVLGWKAGLVVLLIDMFKGFVPVYFIASYFQLNPETVIYFQVAAAVAAIAGHIWTMFAGFRGGKGVGTSAGALLALAPIPLLCALFFFVFIVALTHYVSLGSLLASLIFLLVLLLQKYVLGVSISMVLIYLSLLIAILIWYAHRSNIKRLLKGQENRIEFKKSVKKEG